MRWLVGIYLFVMCLCLGLVWFLLMPGALFLVAAWTFGIGYLLVFPLIQLTFWLVVFAPAVLGLLVHRGLGAGLAAVALALVLSFPAWLPDPGRTGPALLAPPVAARAPVEARSVAIDLPQLPRDWEEDPDSLLHRLLSNPELDWVRVRTWRGQQLFQRTEGIMMAQAFPRDRVPEADVTVIQPEYRRDPLLGGGLSPWKVEEAQGYLILGKGRSDVLARNLGLTLFKGERPWEIILDGGYLGGAPPRLDLVRASVGAVQPDESRRLEQDLLALGLISEKSAPAPDAGVAPVHAVERIVARLIEEREQNDPRRYGRGNWSALERRAIEAFNDQIAARVRIDARGDLIARGERLGIVGPKPVVMAIAEENPEIMGRMVTLYQADVAQKGPEHRLARLKAEDMAPLARAVGRDRATLEALFVASERGNRATLIETLFALAPDDLYAILAHVFDSFAPISDLDRRLTPEYFALWSSRDYGRDILSGAEVYSHGVGWATKEGLADLALETLLRQPDVPPAVIREFVLRWSLTRDYPFMFDPDLIRKALDALEAAGFAAEHAQMTRYFMQFAADPAPLPDPPIPAQGLRPPARIDAEALSE